MSVDIHALSGAYAVDAVDEFERAQFERHLSDCASCRAEVDSLREAGSLISHTSSQPAPQSLRAAVLAGIATVRPLPPVVIAATERGRSTRRRFPALVAAAAALITIGGVGATVWHPWDEDSSQVELSASEKVIQASDAERIEREFEGGGKVTLVRSKALDQAVIVTEAMPDAPVGNTYALWFDHDGDMVPAGELASGANTVLLEGRAGEADGVGITVEQAGVEPTVPGELVDLIAFKQT